jgi:hypothetical protein
LTPQTSKLLQFDYFDLFFLKIKLRVFWKKKKKESEWSNCNNLEVGGVKCHVLNIGGQSANELIVQGGKNFFPRKKLVVFVHLKLRLSFLQLPVFLIIICITAAIHQSCYAYAFQVVIDIWYLYYIDSPVLFIQGLDHPWIC